MRMLLQRKIIVTKLITYIFFFIGVICAVFPIIWMVFTALKPQKEILSFPVKIIPSNITFINFVNAWKKAPFDRYFFNSFLITGSVVGGQLFFSSMAAFAFARIKFPGKTFFFFCFLSSMMIPGIVLMIPQFITMRIMRLLDTYWALILPGFLGSAFCVFFMRQFFLTMPDSLQEAAELDGCSYVRIYLQIFMPMSTHALVTLGLIRMVAVWNDFLWPLIVTNRDRLRTVPLGISSSFFNFSSIDYAGLMSASTIALLPIIILFIVTRDYIIESISLTGFK